MPVPKRKRSRARRDSRFADKGLVAKQFTNCSNCDKVLTSHAACSGCGFYKGVKVLVTKNERSAKRLEARRAQDARKSQQSKSAPENE